MAKPIWKPSDILKAAGRRKAPAAEPPAPAPVEVAPEPPPEPEPPPAVERPKRRTVAPVERKAPAPRRGRSPRREEDAAVDVHVGARVRLRRTLLGMSQTTLATAVGLTLQQVQRIENGSSRIGASVLHRLSQALDVPVSFFFDGLEGAAPTVPDADGATRHMLDYGRNLRGISDQEVRRALVALARELAGAEDA